MTESKTVTSSARPTTPGGIPGIFRLWFSPWADVSRLAYLLSGLFLGLFKYGVETAVIYAVTSRILTPLDFLSPFYSMREHYFKPPTPQWLPAAMLVWTLPFLWISISMSERRAANAGFSPWFGLIMLVPGLKWILIVLLCLVPSKPGYRWGERRMRDITLSGRPSSVFLSLAASVALALVMVLLGVYVFKEYGLVLFVATPVLVGAVAGYTYNRPVVRGLGPTILVSQIAILMGGASLLVFAFEGIICLVMLYPIAASMALIGGLVGYSIALFVDSRSSHLMLVLCCLPVLAGAERLPAETPQYEVVSTVEIDAPPEEVWPHVVGFSDLADPPQWYFRLGIAYPKRATIDGTGVGAIRHCEFSTGPFVEPITVWDFPRRLAFDVASQPPPMHELSPYRHVHPPHLDGYLRCKRGEFRLIRLRDNRTRLEGSTWYEFDMAPQDYWTIWSDLCIHQIHLRVLGHIKNLAEQK